MQYAKRQTIPGGLRVHNVTQGPYQAKRRRINWMHVAIHAVLITLSLAFIVPILIVIAGSFSSETALVNNGYSILPQQLTLAGYQYVFLDPNTVFSAYGVTIISTVVGTLFSLTVMSLLAYAISRREFSFRKPLTFFTFFTLLFNGGLVATYIWMTNVLHANDTYIAYILPYACSPFYVLLLRTYFTQLPTELIAAAKIDGANEWQIFLRIILPLSRPALAAVGLLIALIYWNDWYQPLLYISDSHLYSVQYLLYQITQSIYALTQNSPNTAIATQLPPAYSAQMATAVIAIGPIFLAFLFTQRFFVRGLTLGGLKD